MLETKLMKVKVYKKIRKLGRVLTTLIKSSKAKEIRNYKYKAFNHMLRLKNKKMF
jgi:hypothetical protein